MFKVVIISNTSDSENPCPYKNPPFSNFNPCVFPVTPDHPLSPLVYLHYTPCISPVILCLPLSTPANPCYPFTCYPRLLFNTTNSSRQ